MKKIKFIFLLAIFFITDGIAQNRVVFTTPIPCSKALPWGEGKVDPTTGSSFINRDKYWEKVTLPIGNGSIGANVYGSIAQERLTFNEKSLWRGGPNTSKGAEYYWNVNKQSAHLLDSIRQAFLDNDISKAAELTQNNFNGYASYEADGEEPFRFGSYTTCGVFDIATGLSQENTTHYTRSLSLDSALVDVQFVNDGVTYQRNFFASYPDHVIVAHFTASKSGQQNLSFSYSPNPLSTGKYSVKRGNELCYKGSLNNNGMKYAVRVKAINRGGEVSVDKKGVISVKKADEVFFIITADTDYKPNMNPDFSNPKSYVGVKPLNTTKEWIKDASRYTYSQLLERHLQDYMSLFGRTQFQLNPNYSASTNLCSLSTPERLKRYRTGAPDYDLETLYYQFGRYLLIASSRPGNLPANLQGMWHNNVDGPWRIDYHNNINLQMNYWPACPTNLTECELPLIEFIRSQIKSGAVTAKSYFGARGWTTSISSNIFGFTSPLRDKDMSWNFSPMAGPWLATHIWNYYDYTRDLNFLRQNYDILKGSAQFVVDCMWRKADGTYTLAPSTSPEHGPIDEGTTFCHAVAKELLVDAIHASELLDEDASERQHWQSVLKNIAPYQVGRYGQLMEWSKDIDNPYDAHRHVNHLFGLHPGHTISPVTTPKLAKASKVVLEHRGDGATGWSMGWKLNQWARLHDGNRSYKLYGNLLKNGTNDNLWDSHPPFQIDGNFGGVAGVTEMLLQSHMGFIHLLPALPTDWHDGKLTGIRARGNFVVDLYWKDNNLTKVIVYSGSGVPCQLVYKGDKLSFNTQAGQSYCVRFNGDKMKVNLLNH